MICFLSVTAAGERSAVFKKNVSACFGADLRLLKVETLSGLQLDGRLSTGGGFLVGGVIFDCRVL